MKSLLIPFALAALVTVLIGVGVRMTPYFPGDVQLTRMVQSAAPNPGWWAAPVSRLAPAPAKYYVMVVAAVTAFTLAGWRGLLIVAAFIALEQYGAESTKSLFQRPRPSRTLVNVAGSPTGLSFPSTTITFFSVTFGAVALIALMRKSAQFRWPIFIVSSVLLVLGCLARVVLGAHWPSDVILTSVICLMWIWAASRATLGRA